jgi:flagellar basal-body rod protein FlgF
MDTPDALASAASGMRVQAAELDVIARNLANVSTSGYRAQTQAFSANGEAFNSHLGVSQSQGPLRHTGVPTDLALVGPGYFAVATPEGVRYTRDGRLAIDPRGYLRDASGNPVLGSMGPARFPHNARILDDGRIVVSREVVDRLRIVTFDAPCSSSDGNLLAAPKDSVPKRSFANVRCGYLEDSGVDAISEMTLLIRAQRSFEANQKSLQETDESLRRLVTEVPAVRP